MYTVLLPPGGYPVAANKIYITECYKKAPKSVVISELGEIV